MPSYWIFVCYICLLFNAAGSDTEVETTAGAGYGSEVETTTSTGSDHGQIKEEPDFTSSGHFMAFFIPACVLAIAAYVVYNNRKKVTLFHSCLKRDCKIYMLYILYSVTFIIVNDLLELRTENYVGVRDVT